MKKQIFMLALVVGVILSVCMSAFAETTTYNHISDFLVEYETFNRVTTRTDKTFTVAVIAEIGESTSDQNKPYAPQILFSYTDSDGVATGTKLAGSENGSFVATNGQIPISTTLTGTMTGKEGSITVKAVLYLADGTTQVGTEYSKTINFSATIAPDEFSSGFQTGAGPAPAVEDEIEKYNSENILDGTGADPTSANWDGVLLPITNLGNYGSNFPKDKPKVGSNKIETKNDPKKKGFITGKAEDITIDIQGDSLDVVDVYISYKDAQKLWPAQKANFTSDAHNVHFNSGDVMGYKLPFRVTKVDSDDTTSTKKVKNETLGIHTTHITISYNGAYVSYKGFPITISAQNNATKDRNGKQKPITKTFKFDIISPRSEPQWVTYDGTIGENLGYYDAKDKWKATKNSEEISLKAADDQKVSSVSYTVSGDSPYTVSGKGDIYGAKYGITAIVVAPKTNNYGETIYPGYVTFSGSMKDKTKETKSAFTLDAAASAKKKSFKATIVGKMLPYYTAKQSFDLDGDNTYYLSGIKRVEAGKVPSVTFKPSGSKTITFSIGDSDLAKLNAVNLSFDTKKGSVVALKGSDGKSLSSKPTLLADEFESIDITVTATNDAGDADMNAWVAVTGAKPALTKASQKLTIAKSLAVGEIVLISCDAGKVKNISKDNKDNKIKYRLEDKASTKSSAPDTAALEALGLELISTDYIPSASKETYRNYGVLRVKSALKAASKGQTVNLLLDNFGATNKGSITISIFDPAPEIEVSSPDSFSKIEIQATSKDPVVQKVELKLTSETKPSDGSKITWKAEFSPKPTAKTKPTIAGKADPKSADIYIVTVTAPKNCDNYKGSVKVTATNDGNKLVGTYLFSADIAAVVTANTKNRNGSAAPVDEAELDDEFEAEEPAEPEAEETDDDAEAEEEPVIFGAPRTAAQLTAGQNAFLAEKGYKVVAVLPEITAKVDGLQEFEVELDEDAPEGAKLIWLAFPQNAEETDDDKIADFYDAEGSEIEEVPAGKVIIAEPWLRAGVRYQPVIAVEE